MSGGGSKAPTGYQPTGQPQADQNYQNLVSGAQPYATSLPSTVVPGLTNVAANVAANPYYAQAQQGATDAAAQGATTAGYQANAAQNLYGAGTTAGNVGANLGAMSLGLGGDAQTIGAGALGTAAGAVGAGANVYNAGVNSYGQTQGLIPSTTQGANYAGGQLSQADLLANLSAGGALSAIPGLTGGMDAANQILQTGFDPQSALYNRTLQQTTDQSNAINAMNGVSGSPYGAGLATQANQNFNIDWQNNQLSRETQALGAYGTEQGVDTNDLTSLLGSAAGNYANLTNAGVNQYTGLTSNAASNLSNLTNTGMNALSTGNSAYNQGINTYLSGANTALAGNAQGQNAVNSAGTLYNNGLNAMGTAYNQGSQLGIDSLQTSLASSSAPSTTYLQQQQADAGALSTLATSGAASFAPTQTLIGDENQYLQTGQNATTIAQKGVAQNNDASNAMWSSLGSAAGTAAMFLI